MMAKIRKFRGRVLPTVEQLVTEGAFPTQPVDEPVETPLESLVYSATEAALLLNVSMKTIYKYCRNGTIPSVRVGSKVLIPRSAPIFQMLEAIGQEGFDANQST